MKEILDQMEEHIAAIRNIQRNYDYHSRRLEKLMRTLSGFQCNGNSPVRPSSIESERMRTE